MIKYVIRRLGAAIIQVLLVTLIAYLLFYVIASVTGASPAQRVAGRSATPERVAEVAHTLGIDRPIYVQYADFLWRILHGDFGQSFLQRRPVADILFPAMKVTLSLLLGATILWMVFAIPVGLIGAYWPQSVSDKVLGVIIQILISAPVFWIAPMVSYLLAYQPSQGLLFGIHLGHPIAWLPIQGYTSFDQSIMEWVRNLILPWFALSLGYAAFYARFVRALVGEQLDEEYILVARSKGASEGSILRRHVAPLVGTNLIVMIGLDVGAMLGGALFVEQAFGLPGMGFVAYSSIQQLDYPLTIGSITLAAILAVALNTCADILHAAIDPRVRKQ